MRVRLRVLATALEVLSAHQARVHIEVIAADGARLLEIEVEYRPIDCVKILSVCGHSVEYGRRMGSIGVWGGGAPDSETRPHPMDACSQPLSSSFVRLAVMERAGLGGQGKKVHSQHHYYLV